MRSRPVVSLAVFCLCCSFLFSASGAEPENLALRARVTADSEYNAVHAAIRVNDGKIPDPMGRNDAGASWVAQGATHRNGATLTFSWDADVTIGEVIYYGRTGFAWGEIWQSAEIYVDDVQKPVAKDRFVVAHGPQRITLESPVSARTLRVKFIGSYGGPNPGAAEVEIYASSPPADRLIKLEKPAGYATTQAAPFLSETESPELAGRLAAAQFGFNKILLIQRHHIQCSHVYTYHCEGQKNGGGLYVLDVRKKELTRLVDATEGQISNCDLHSDGRQVLFAWRNRGEFYQIYRINVDGTRLEQLTFGDFHSFDPCWLPNGDIIYLSTKRPLAAYCFFTDVGILHRMRADGTGSQCISANYLNDFTPAVMNDGRLIYGRWEYVDRPAIPIQSLWTIHPDGTGLSAFFGNRVLDPASFIEPQPIPGTEKILCTLTGHNGSCRGAIGMIDPSYGLNAQEGILNLTPDVPLRGVTVSSNGPRGPYQTPMPVDDRYFLVSHDGTILLRDYANTQQTTVLAPQGGSCGYYNPIPIRTQPRKPVLPSCVEGNPEIMAFNKGLPKLPPELKEGVETGGTDQWATLFLQDVHVGLGPDVKPGEIKRIAVVQEIERTLIDSPGIRRPDFDFQRMVVSCGATYVPKKVWGFVDVSEDGSAMFRIPAMKPIYFIALDAEGRGVQRMRSFTHLMPGEVQSCVGCHEERNETSVAHSPNPVALAEEVRTPRIPEWGLQGFGYLSIVQPVLDRHCVECHGAIHPPKGIDLTGDLTDYFCVSYETLARGRTVQMRGEKEVSFDNPYTSWIPTYNGHEKNIWETAPRRWGSPRSLLADVVVNGHPENDDGPRFALTHDERQRILTWIDLNVPYYGTAQTAWPTRQGCRRQYPEELDKTLADVARRRCASCHDQVPRTRWVRITNPDLNPFLLAPLAKAAGGTGRCGDAVFRSKEDPDYQAIIQTFTPVLDGLAKKPRMDMPGAIHFCPPDGRKY